MTTNRTAMQRAQTIVIACAMAAAAVPARAQSTAQIPLQFDFMDPGARSLALGSAFIAVADDATAAFTNPAGLPFMVKPEVSAELRYRRLETPFLSGGRLSGTVTNNGQDTIAGPVYGTSADSAARPYFLSAVIPGNRWAVALYRHELVRQNNDFTSNGAFESAVFGGQVVNVSRAFGLQGTRSIAIDTYGAAVGYRFSPQFSAGVGVAAYRLELSSRFAQLAFLGGNTFAPVDPNQTLATATQQGSGTRAGVNAGVLITATPQVRIGATFRQGLSFDFTQIDTIPGAPTLTRSGSFSTPFSAGVGVRVQPSERVSFSVDYDRVQYSRLKADYINFQALATNSQNQLSIADANEIHGGVEYVFTDAPHSPAIRGGVWLDPNHSVQYQSDNSNSQTDVRLKALFPNGDDVVHYCFGFGVPVSSAFEFNVGADLTKQRKYVSGSIVARFGK